jgi:hypothetical protein
MNVSRETGDPLPFMKAALAAPVQGQNKLTL